MRAPSRWRDWTTVTDNGVIGDPSRASADKRERLLNAAAAAVAEALLAPALWRLIYVPVLAREIS
jgi:creatinine amidohydrolase/Fe(II)-dependent formamide hydrolase-like protein